MCISTREWGGRLFALVVRFDCGMCDGGEGVLSHSAIGVRNSQKFWCESVFGLKTDDKGKDKSRL